jgi:ABC-type phosphate transport system substrate-binding protein
LQLFADLKNGEGYSSTFDADPQGPDGTVAYVEKNSASVGYVGYAYYFAAGIQLYVSAIQDKTGTFIAPGANTIIDNSYPISRTLYVNLLNDPTSLANTVPFIEFGFSTDGTDIVSTTGYVPIPNPSTMLARLPASSTSTSTGTTGSSKTSSASTCIRGMFLAVSFLVSMSVVFV